MGFDFFAPKLKKKKNNSGVSRSYEVRKLQSMFKPKKDTTAAVPDQKATRTSVSRASTGSTSESNVAVEKTEAQVKEDNKKQNNKNLADNEYYSKFEKLASFEWDLRRVKKLGISKTKKTVLERVLLKMKRTGASWFFRGGARNRYMILDNEGKTFLRFCAKTSNKNLYDKLDNDVQKMFPQPSYVPNLSAYDPELYYLESKLQDEVMSMPNRLMLTDNDSNHAMQVGNSPMAMISGDHNMIRFSRKS